MVTPSGVAGQMTVGFADQPVAPEARLAKLEVAGGFRRHPSGNSARAELASHSVRVADKCALELELGNEVGPRRG
jgi:hypothetical protein